MRLPLNWYVVSGGLFRPLTVCFKVPKEGEQLSHDPTASCSHKTSIALESIHDSTGDDLDPAVQEAIVAIRCFETSRTKISKIPRGVLLSACSSFQIDTGETPLDGLRKVDILSKVHDWVCVWHLAIFLLTRGLAAPQLDPRQRL